VLLLLCAAALAGEIQVTVATPMGVFIDGQPREYDPGLMQVTARDVATGTHTVTVRNMLGKRIAELSIEVPADLQVRLHYAKKQLSVVGSAPLSGAATPSQAVTDAAVAVGAMADAVAGMMGAAEDLANAVDASSASAPAPDANADSTPGSLEIAGLSALSDAVWLDGAALEYRMGTDSYMAVDLPPGGHHLRIEKSDRLKHDGAVQIGPGQHTRCLMAYEGLDWVLQCGALQGARTSADRDAAIATFGVSTSGTSVSVTTTTVSAPPALPTPVEVVFLRQDHMDMGDVFVDGEKVAKFRTGGDDRESVSLMTGTHTVIIKDFTGFDTWSTGTLTVTAGDAIKVGFGEDEGVEVYNRTGAWSAR